jgi:hypothetical protein
MTYFVKLTEGNSSGNYNIYYDSITPGNSNLMTLVATNTLASNVTLEQLLQGVEVSSPVVPNKVIVYGVECDVALNLTFTKSTPVTIPPIYCITYLTDTQKTLQLTPQTTLYNGEIQWVTTDGTKNLRWNPYYNGGRGRWEMNVDTNLILVNELKTGGLPAGNWFFIGSIVGSSVDTLNKTLVVSEGICTPTQTFSCSLISTPNSCSGTKTYDGTITVTVLGGTPPYSYDNGLKDSTWPVFSSLAPGDYTVVARDANGNETSCFATVGDGEKKLDYLVSLNYTTNDVFSNFDTKTKRTSFDLSVQPAIPAGTTITVTLSFTDIRIISSPGTGTVSNTLEISKNGEVIPVTTVVTRQLNTPRDNCSNYNTIESILLKDVTFTLTSGDVLEGFLTSTVNLTSPQVDSTSNCATELKNNFFIGKITLTSNCKCCTVTSAESTPLQIMDNLITATKKATPGAIPIQLAYSQADCDTACSATINTYYSPCFTMGPNCELFTDTTLTTKPPEGYYSDYTYCYYFNGDSIVDKRTCPLEPPTNTIKYYTADVFRCAPFNCTNPIDNIVVTVNSNYDLVQNSYYRDVEYSNFVYKITRTRGITGPASREMDPGTQFTDCQACCSITPPSP